MHEASASSLTTAFGQTDANSASLETGSPARTISALNTEAAFGVTLTSRSPDQSRPLDGSNRNGPKLTLCRLARSISSAPMVVPVKFRRKPGVPPGLLGCSCLLYSHIPSRWKRPLDITSLETFA